MKLEQKKIVNQRRRWRIRRKIRGTEARPRLCVRFSHRHIYAQCIDDDAGRSLVYLSTLGKDLREQDLKPNLNGAAAFGRQVGEKTKAAGIEKVVFDRAGRRYHGCVKAFADAAREAGLQF